MTARDTAGDTVADTVRDTVWDTSTSTGYAVGYAREYAQGYARGYAQGYAQGYRPDEGIIGLVGRHEDELGLHADLGLCVRVRPSVGASVRPRRRVATRVSIVSGIEKKDDLGSETVTVLNGGTGHMTMSGYMSLSDRVRGRKRNHIADSGTPKEVPYPDLRFRAESEKVTIGSGRTGSMGGPSGGGVISLLPCSNVRGRGKDRGRCRGGMQADRGRGRRWRRVFGRRGVSAPRNRSG